MSADNKRLSAIGDFIRALDSVTIAYDQLEPSLRGTPIVRMARDASFVTSAQLGGTLEAVARSMKEREDERKSPTGTSTGSECESFSGDTLKDTGGGAATEDPPDDDRRDEDGAAPGASG